MISGHDSLARHGDQRVHCQPNIIASPACTDDLGRGLCPPLIAGAVLPSCSLRPASTGTQMPGVSSIAMAGVSLAVLMVVCSSGAMAHAAADALHLRALLQASTATQVCGASFLHNRSEHPQSNTEKAVE